MMTMKLQIQNCGEVLQALKRWQCSQWHHLHKGADRRRLMVSGQPGLEWKNGEEKKKHTHNQS